MLSLCLGCGEKDVELLQLNIEALMPESFSKSGRLNHSRTPTTPFTLRYLPFGAGARFCPGATLAVEQLRLFAAESSLSSRVLYEA